MAITVSLLFTLVVGLLAFFFFACMCAVWKRMENTDFDKKPHTLPMALALYQLVLWNCVCSVTNRWDDLTELVVGHYLQAYTRGKNGMYSSDSYFDQYVRPNKVSKPFHNALIRLMRSAYHNGENYRVRQTR